MSKNQEYKRRRARTKKHNRALRKAQERSLKPTWGMHHISDEACGASCLDSLYYGEHWFDVASKVGDCCVDHRGFWPDNTIWELVVLDWALYTCSICLAAINKDLLDRTEFEMEHMLHCLDNLTDFKRSTIYTDCWLELYIKFSTKILLRKNGEIHVPTQEDICAIDQTTQLLNR